jgi:hypothetical protein
MQRQPANCRKIPRIFGISQDSFGRLYVTVDGRLDCLVQAEPVLDRVRSNFPLRRLAVGS